MHIVFEVGSCGLGEHVTFQYFPHPFSQPPPSSSPFPLLLTLLFKLFLVCSLLVCIPRKESYTSPPLFFFFFCSYVMSFFNTFRYVFSALKSLDKIQSDHWQTDTNSSFPTSRGFGRSSKKNKNAESSNASASSNTNNSSSNLSLSNSDDHHSQPASQTYSNGNNNNNNNNNNSSASSQKPLFLCQPFVRTSLVRGSFQTIVQVPKYVDQNEWLVLNVFEFYQYLNLFYGVIAEFVTPQTCPTMNAGPGIDYLWIDSNKQPVRLPANTYIDYVLTWISNKFDDPTLFPTKQNVPFPSHFMGVLKNIYRQMFRIFAHIYHNHFDKFVHLSMEAHWNSFFAHFISFGKDFDLLERKEMEPLMPLIEYFESQGKI